jgi:hypothetical protein
VVEAAIAFGSTPWQVLWEAQIPLAMPTILAGLNQTILFALGMSVVTSMIAVPGLGLMVLQKVYGLENTVNQDKGQWEVLLADIVARYKQGKPVLYFSRNSDWVNSVLQPGKDVIRLEVPSTSLPGEMGKGMTQKDTTADGKNLGFAVDKARFVASRQFLLANPAAKRWFERIQVPFEDIITQEKLAYEGQNRPKDIRRHAEEHLVILVPYVLIPPILTFCNFTHFLAVITASQFRAPCCCSLNSSKFEGSVQVC